VAGCPLKLCEFFDAFILHSAEECELAIKLETAIWRNKHKKAFLNAFGKCLCRPLFGAFAEICFAAFGDRVKHWATFNEIHHAAFVFPNVGCRAPSGMCGDPQSMPYIIAHYMLLSHAKAVGIYRTKFQVQSVFL
jgi:hypothetical protein